MMRETMTTAEAAELLECTRQNVSDLYKRKRLEGPKRAPRSRILLWKEEVEEWNNLRGTRKHGRDSKSRIIASVEAALRSIDKRLQRLETEGDTKSTAFAGLIGVVDELETALDGADKAAAFLSQAVSAMQESFEARRRANRLRDEMIRQALIPAAPTDATE